MNQQSFNNISSTSRDLIQQLANCALVCEACAAACLNEDDVEMMTRCIELDRDCADLCELTSRLIIRESEVLNSVILACEEICRLCAEECRKHDMEHCKECAAACEKCAETCHQAHSDLQQRR